MAIRLPTSAMGFIFPSRAISISDFTAISHSSLPCEASSPRRGRHAIRVMKIALRLADPPYAARASRICALRAASWFVKDDAGLQTGRHRPRTGFELLAVEGLDASNFEAPVGAHDFEAVGFHRDDLAQLSADALRVLGWQRLGIEDLQGLAGQHRPRARCWIATTDQAIDLYPGFPPIDARIVGTTPALVSGLRFILLETWRPASLNQSDRLEHPLHTQREQPVKIDGPQRVIGADRRFLLQKHVAGVEAVVGPKDR